MFSNPRILDAILGVSVAVAIPTGWAAASSQAPSSVAEPVRAEALVAALEQRIADYYVDPAIVPIYRQALDRALAAGDFEGLSGDALAARINEVIQGAHPDLHLSLYAPGRGMYGVEDEQGEPDLPDNDLEAAGWIAPGVAYIRPFAFFNRPDDRARLQAFMDSHAEAKAMILDLRHHHGGELAEIDILFRDLFARPVDLLTMTTRPVAWDRFEKKVPTANLAVLKRDSTMVSELHRALPREGGARLSTVPVYALTSKNTASAGEHLALALKKTGRARLIGETTRGAGHFGNEVDVLGGYSMFIPYGDTVDPATGKGWEQTGVEPDERVPAKEALGRALAELGLAPVAEAYPKL